MKGFRSFSTNIVRTVVRTNIVRTVVRTNIVRTVVRTNIVRTVVGTNIVRTVVRAYAVDILGKLVCIIDVYIKQDVEAG